MIGNRCCGAAAGLLLVLLLPPAVTLATEPLLHDGIELREDWIAMPDGVRLAADLYLPAQRAEGDRFPVLLEYLPYRKDEGRGGRFSDFSWFVRNGYVVARVDIRGTGRSDGRLVDYEYTEQEQKDGEIVIDWLSRQPFATGNVGMFGISWGGFNSIHMAMRRPPALKAIVPVMATDDIYQDDVHFMDGIMHVDAWEIGQDLWNALPGAPDYRIDEEYFRNRFDTTPWLLVQKRQQRDGPHWNRASLNRDYSLIDIPVFVIGGWYDGYRDSVPRMLQHLDVPVKGMMGPWNHTWPNQAVPPPAIEWRHEAVRWFDQWLKGKNTGVMDEPAFSIFVRNWHPPGTAPESIPGRWRREPGWPLERIENRQLYLSGNHELTEMRPGEGRDELRYVPTVGVEASGSVMWWGDWAPDQRAADTFTLVYESEPLRQDLEILGFPNARLNVGSSAALAHWIVRLSDVAPDGRVTQVAGAALNGAHRESAEHPVALQPGRSYPINVELHFTSWIFPAGHRIRLAVGNAQWPMFWPTPHAMTTTLELGGKDPSHLLLPIIPRTRNETTAPIFMAPATDPELPGYESLEAETVSGYPEISRIVRDERKRTTEVTATNSGADRYPWGVIRYTEEIVHSAADDNPAVAGVKSRYTLTAELPERTLAWEGLLDFRSTAADFHYDYTRRLLENGKLLREKRWQETIPRDYQ